jgi:hypothetical protein
LPADCIRPILKKGFDPGFFDLGLFGHSLVSPLRL